MNVRQVRTCAYIVLCTVTVGYAGGALAGDTKVNRLFRDFSRVPEEYQPDSFELSESLRLKMTPSLWTDAEYISDAHPQRSGEASDFVVRVTPEVDFTSKSSRHLARFRFLGSQHQHLSESDETVSEFDMDMELAYVPWGGGRLYYQMGYLVDHLDRSDPDEMNGAERTPMYQTPVKLGYRQRGTKMGFHLGFFFTDFNHNDPPILNAGDPNLVATVMDREEFGYDASFEHDISEWDTLYVNGRYYNVAYDNTDVLGGRLVADVDADEWISRSSTGWNVIVGNKFKKPDSYSGDIFVGYASQSFDATERDDVSTVDFGLNLNFPFGEKYTLRSEIDRRIEETRVSGASSYVQTAADVSLDYMMAEDWFIGGNVKGTLRSFEGINRDDTIFEGGLNTTWYMKPWLHLNGKVSYATQSAEGTGRDYDIMKAGVGMGLQF